jgi:hypothetical protein
VRSGAGGASELTPCKLRSRETAVPCRCITQRLCSTLPEPSQLKLCTDLRRTHAPMRHNPIDQGALRMCSPSPSPRRALYAGCGTMAAWHHPPTRSSRRASVVTNGGGPWSVRNVSAVQLYCPPQCGTMTAWCHRHTRSSRHAVTHHERKGVAVRAHPSRTGGGPWSVRSRAPGARGMACTRATNVLPLGFVECLLFFFSFHNLLKHM